MTGASSGIGASICKELCKHGVIVVGLARRLEKLNQLREEILALNEKASFHSVKCDLTEESEIQAAFDYIQKSLCGVDILINNAGVAKDLLILESDLDALKHIMDTNLTGLVSCTKKAYLSMSERNRPGYIINISSVAGYSVLTLPGGRPSTNVYSPSKFGLRALNTVLRHELNYLKKNNIRISTISPGLVKSELTGHMEMLPILEAQDISDVVVYMLGTDPRVQIEDVLIRPAGESF